MTGLSDFHAHLNYFSFAFIPSFKPYVVEKYSYLFVSSFEYDLLIDGSLRTELDTVLMYSMRIYSELLSSLQAKSFRVLYFVH